jgi:hypothetical protein
MAGKPWHPRPRARDAHPGGRERARRGSAPVAVAGRACVSRGRRKDTGALADLWDPLGGDSRKR